MRRSGIIKKVIVFTDGACSGNPGPGGWAAILCSPLGKIREIGGSEASTTNNKMELRAAIEALELLAKFNALSTREIIIYTDSKYIIHGINEWIFSWKKNGWKTSEGKEVSNRELWEKLLRVIEKNIFSVEWKYIPGHSGFPGNERCDEIAVAFSKGYTVDLFQGDKNKYAVDLSQVPDETVQAEKVKPTKKGKPLYLSFVRGAVYRDKEWRDCEARVKGVHGAKYKKIYSLEEENEVLKSWGAK